MSSTTFKRRRRRTGSTSHRYTPADIARSNQVRHRIGAMEIAGAVIAVVISAALIVLIWMVTSRSIVDQRDQVRDLAQRNLTGQATVMARSVGYELLVIDQSLTVLQQAWNQDAGLFDINKWKTQMPALMAVADDLFVADDKRIIKQDILPQAVGQGIASAYVSWPHGALEKLGAAAPKIGSPLGTEATQQGVDARRFIMYIVRPLQRPAGWIIGASFRTDEMAKLYSNTWFGVNALAGIVDLQNGGLQTIIGPAARRPQRSLGKTDLYAAMQKTENGIWVGQSPIDGVQRMHAFYRVPDRDMTVLVAATESELMAPAELFATGARGVAVAATGTIVGAAVLIAWAFYRFRATRRQQAIAKRHASELDRLRQDESRLTERAQLQSVRLRALIDNTSDGIALLDPELRMVQWNQRFEQGIGVPLAENMALDALIRQQSAAGMIDQEYDDLEVEVRERVRTLISGEGAVPQVSAGPDERVLRGVALPEGGLVLLLTGVGNIPLPAAYAPQTIMPEVQHAFVTVDW
ncbi:MAG: PAS-domain containing protein [Acetobacteraceae bacterium]|nr:PAS-domain containing protein [Pseudomonadota bacterium]